MNVQLEATRAAILHIVELQRRSKELKKLTSLIKNVASTNPLTNGRLNTIVLDERVQQLLYSIKGLNIIAYTDVTGDIEVYLDLLEKQQ